MVLTFSLVLSITNLLILALCLTLPVLEKFDFGMSRSLEKSFLSIQFTFVNLRKYEWY